MKPVFTPVRLAACLVALLVLGIAGSARAADTITWNTNQDRVTADINSTGLLQVLERIAAATRWHVFVEPDTLHSVSAKFKDLPPGEALHRLLGDVNYVLMPSATNAAPRLYVFRSSRQNATQLVQPAREHKSRLIPNELIVRVKPGADINDIARRLGAKVIGRIEGLNAYRLQFDDAAAADTARAQLAGDSQVASVDSNYLLDPPSNPQSVQLNGPATRPALQMKPPPDSGRLIIGLVDTGVQDLGQELDKFMLKSVSVAGDPQFDPNSPSHGTAMAETMLKALQTVTGGSTSIQILPVDVYGPNEATTSFDVANGIIAAVNGGAKVINLSLGSDTDNPFLASVIQQAIQNNIVLFGAAGNEPVTTPSFPAADPGVNAVTALSAPGMLAPYANRGNFITLGAPGQSIFPFGPLWFDAQGTSTATANVSAAFTAQLEANGGDMANAKSWTDRVFGYTPK